MASFATHLGGAAVASAMASSLLVVADQASLATAAVLFGLGMLGGILPDVDSDTSRPVVWIFNAFGTLAATITLWLLVPYVSFDWWPLCCLWGAMAAAYALAGPVAMQVFFRLTVHRGVLHSLLAALSSGLLTTVLVSWLPASDGGFCWQAGIFVAGGFVVHLLLDEISAVDFNGMRLKKSFGSALKPLSLDNWQGSLGLAVLCLVLLVLAPAPQEGVSLSAWLGGRLDGLAYSSNWGRRLLEWLPS
ncbi:metal-dependent hydrolase [Oceanobacter mangrovi]|uniref:metal-dependent hydrolase n=1 Tax=Oceanobacter mangrovi TaxID=2862510 RepID=UPI001C8E3FA0|nr:metal-dependent hydrolase [Oceanobacter mangrovi]